MSSDILMSTGINMSCWCSVRPMSSKSGLEYGALVLLLRLGRKVVVEAALLLEDVPIELGEGLATGVLLGFVRLDVGTMLVRCPCPEEVA